MLIFLLRLSNQSFSQYQMYITESTFSSAAKLQNRKRQSIVRNVHRKSIYFLPHVDFCFVFLYTSKIIVNSYDVSTDITISIYTISQWQNSLQLKKKQLLKSVKIEKSQIKIHIFLCRQF